MSDIIIFIIGVGITALVGSAVGLLVWGASQERYVSGRHRGGDLLRSADEGLRVDDRGTARVQVLPGGKAVARRARAAGATR